MPAQVGVDIGSYAIKVAAVKAKGHEFEIEGLFSAYNPTGQFCPADPMLAQKLAATIKQLLTENKLNDKPVYLGLPESQVFTSVISLPFLSDAELASSIHWEAEQHIPVPLSEVNLEYEVLYKPKKGSMGEKMRVLLVAAKKEVVACVVDVLHNAGIEVVGLSTILLSVYKALAPTLSTESATVICHMGALATDLIVIDNGSVVLTYTIQSGGLALTRAVERGLALAPSQAEEYKRAYGMDQAQLEGKVRSAIMPVMQAMVAEIRKALQYYQSAQGRTGLKTMMLSGGAVYLPGLSSFLAEMLGIEVVIANPVAGFKVKEGVNIPSVGAVFSGALGLAAQKEEE